MIDRQEEAVCAVCARHATGWGYGDYSRFKKPRILWLCDDPECITIAKATYEMKQDEFTRIESLAAGKGGQEAGAFLEQIGKTDLAKLTQAEWFEFCRRLIAGYRKALKQGLCARVSGVE